MGMFDKLFGDKSPVDRYVGGTGEQRKKMRKNSERVFKEQSTHALERPKTPEELQMIEIANRETDRLREKYGMPKYDVPPENYHVMRKKDPEAASRAHYNLDFFEIMVEEGGGRNQMLARFFHETVHFKSYLSANAGEPDIRRSGLSLKVEGERPLLFKPLNEAVTEELTKRFMRAQEDLPMLAEETHNLRRGREVYGAAVMEDVANVTVTPGKESGTLYVDRHHFGYANDRRALGLLIDKLKERNPKTFRDKDEWFDMFAGAMFNGHLLELARAVEGTFGKGKFRELGECKTGEDFLKFVESL